MGLEILLAIGSAIVGALLSWPIAHWYYRRAAKEAPEWAQPLIDKLPDAPISQERLVTLYNEAIESGEIDPHAFTGYTRCPKCGASQEYFEPWEAWDNVRGDGYRGFRCGKCKYEISGGEV